MKNQNPENNVVPFQGRQQNQCLSDLSELGDNAMAAMMASGWQPAHEDLNGKFASPAHQPISTVLNVLLRLDSQASTEYSLIVATHTRNMLNQYLADNNAGVLFDCQLSCNDDDELLGVSFLVQARVDVWEALQTITCFINEHRLMHCCAVVHHLWLVLPHTHIEATEALLLYPAIGQQPPQWVVDTKIYL